MFFEILLYQQEYDWEKKEIKDFIFDIKQNSKILNNEKFPIISVQQQLEV